MNEILTTIKEVQEGGKNLANWYLSHGYILLDIQLSSRAERYPTQVPNGQQYFMRRNPIYVLGRPAGVDIAPLIPNPGRAPDEKKDNTAPA